MTETVQENQVQEAKSNEKELNFRRLEAKYQQELSVERSKREEAERAMQQYSQKKEVEEEEDSSEPYVDHKKLSKSLSKFGQSTKSDIQKAMEEAKRTAKEELKQEMWMESHSDFHDVLSHAEEFAKESKDMADTILRMPDTF